MEDAVIIIILIAVLGGAAFYIYRSKKKGRKCIGCPYADSCPSGGGCSCNGASRSKKQRNKKR